MRQERIYLFYGILIIGFLILLGRLFELQVIKGGKNRTLADGNRIQKIINPAPRGIIYDRKKRQLVRNVPVYRLKIEGDGEENWKIISRDQALILEAKQETENLRTDIGREYLYGEALAHVLGYLGEANKEEVREGWRKAGEIVGRTGVEEKYDEILRGVDGGELFEVDAGGVKIRQIGKIDPLPGKDLYLNIDAQLMEIAYAALEGKTGAVVVSDLAGRILALISFPSYDPNIFRLGEENRQKIFSLFNDPLKPFFNRSLAGLYPPGSTFKIVTAVAGLEEGKIDKKTVFLDPGRIQVGNFTYNNWYFRQYGKTEGEINLVRAIKRSTDTFFYKVGEWVGPEKLAEWGKRFGLGEGSGIDLPGEAAGLVPDPQWKIKTMKEKWFLGNTYHFAIGQADLLSTPLQVNLMTAVIANGGRLCRPQISSHPTGDTGRHLPSVRHDSSLPSRQPGEVEATCKDIGLKKETIDLVKEGMKEACSPGGTAFPFFNFEPRVACKTGTAEFGDPAGRTHAWLTVFVLPGEALAKSGSEPIVVTVLVEGGGEGSSVAAPIAKKVMEAWFSIL